MKITMEEINELYKQCGLQEGSIEDDISMVRDFPLPNKLATGIKKTETHSEIIRGNYGYYVCDDDPQTTRDELSATLTALMPACGIQTCGIWPFSDASCGISWGVFTSAG